jgi:hypothetical protein
MRYCDEPTLEVTSARLVYDTLKLNLRLTTSLALQVLECVYAMDHINVCAIGIYPAHMHEQPARSRRLPLFCPMPA